MKNQKKKQHIVIKRFKTFAFVANVFVEFRLNVVSSF